jgi:hypothetical protein
MQKMARQKSTDQIPKCHDRIATPAFGATRRAVAKTSSEPRVSNSQEKSAFTACREQVDLSQEGFACG